MWGYFLEGFCPDLSLSLCPPMWVCFHVCFMTRRSAPVHAGLDVTPAGFAVYSICPYARLDAHGFSASSISGTFQKFE